MTTGISEPNPHINSTSPFSCPDVPQSYTDLEVLNTTGHTSPRPGPTSSNWNPEGTQGVPWLARCNPKKALNLPLGHTQSCSKTEGAEQSLLQPTVPEGSELRLETEPRG